MAKRLLYDTVTGTDSMVNPGTETYFKFPDNLRPIPGEYFDEFAGDPYRPLSLYGVGESRFDKGLTYLDEPFLQNIRASRQSPIAQLGSSFTQAVVGEIVGGTIEGVGYLFELGEFNDLLSGEDEEFGNVVSRFGKSIREGIREKLPVYEYDYREGQFRPWDWSWWMINGPSIASTIALMVPSGAVAAIPGRLAKGLSYTGKFNSVIRAGRSAGEAAALANRASTNVSRVVAGTTQAIVSRKMESMMEAAGTYDDAYELVISAGKSEEEARIIAAKAAKANYVANWAMLAQDVPQYLLLNKYIGKFSTKSAEKAAQKLGAAAKKEMGQKVSFKDYIPSLSSTYNIGKDMLGEAGEEAYQYFSNQYGMYIAERMINPDLDVSFIPWMKENIDTGELLTSAFFGAIGAGFMHGVGRPVMDRMRGVENEQVLEVRSMAERYATIGKNILNAQKVGDDHRLTMELSKGGVELGIRAAMYNSKELMDSFMDLVESGEFSTASKDLQDFAASDEGKAIIAQDKKNAKEIKKYAQMAYDTFNEVMGQINQEGHTFNKGYKKALDNLKKTGRDVDAEWYKKALASVMTSASINKNIVDDKVQELSTEFQASKEKYTKSANQVFNSLSDLGRQLVFLEAELDALKDVRAKTEKAHPEEIVNKLSDNQKKDLEDWYKTNQLMTSTIEQRINQLKDSYSDEDKANDSTIKVNKKDLTEYRDFGARLYHLKKDSYILGRMLKRYNDGELLSEAEIEKYAKEFAERQEEYYENGFQIGDTVTVGKDGPTATIENITFINGKPVYTVREFTTDEDGNVESATDTQDYDEDDLWAYGTSTQLKAELVDTVSSTINEPNNDPQAEIRQKLYKGGLNDPLTTIADMISMVHIEPTAINQLLHRDPKLNSLLSTPFSENPDFSKMLANSRVEYTIDLSDKQKFWVKHKALKDNIIAIQTNKKATAKTKDKQIKALLDSLHKGIDTNQFNHVIDTIPIKVAVIIKDGDQETRYDGNDEYNLYVHNSDFWNVAAPLSILLKGDDKASEEYILKQRIDTREFRFTLLEELLRSDIAVANNLERLGGHLNRVSTYGTIHERLGDDLTDVDLWVGITDTDGIAYPFVESGVRGQWETVPGSVLFRTNKTLTGEEIFVPATISSLSKEHAEIIWDCYLILAGGFPYSSKLNRDDIKNATVGEILDLLVTQGEKVSNLMQDENQILYLKGRQELHFGKHVIKDISKATDAQRGEFIKWANQHKKYKVPFAVKGLGFRLNSKYKTRTGIKIGSFELKPNDDRTWAQMMMSTPISTGKAGNRYAVVTNVERVVDEKTGEFKESIIHSPSLKVRDLNIKGYNRDSTTKEPVTPVMPVTPEPTVGVTPTTEPVANSLDEILGSIEVIGGDDAVVGFYRNKEVETTTETVSDAEFTWLKNRLKSGATVEMSDRFIEIVKDGQSKQAYGAFRASAISLYSGAVKGTIYHEAFHRVSLGYLSDEERERFYNNARVKYNMPDATDSEIEEKLAEEFRLWRNHKELNAEIEGISIFDWVKNLFNFIKHYFTGANAIQNYEVETLFKLIDRGAFKYHKIKRSRLKELANVEAPLELSTLGEGFYDVPFVNTRAEFEDFIKGLGTILIIQNDIRDLADVKSMNFQRMFSYIYDKFIPTREKAVANLKNYLAAGKFKEGETAEQIQSIINDFERSIALYESIKKPKYQKIYMSHLKKVLRTEYGINVISKDDSELLIDEDEETMSPQELITRYSKESFELNIVDNVTANVKYLISILPKSSKINPITGTYEFVKFKETFDSLLFHLYNLDSLEEMLDKLEELGKTNHAFSVLHKRLVRGSPNLRNQFKVAMSKHKHLYINFTYTRDYGKYDTPVYQIFRADVNRAEEAEKYDWAEQFLMSEYMDHGEKAGDVQKLNIERLTKVYEDYVSFEKEVRRNARKQLSAEELGAYADRFIELVRAVRIDIDKTVLDAYIGGKVRAAGRKSFGVKEALVNLITSEFTSQQGREEDPPGYFYRLKLLAGKALDHEKAVAECKKGARVTDYDLDADIRSIYLGKDSVYAIRELARKRYEVYPDLLSDIVIGPEGHQYYTYSLRTYTSDRIKQLKDKAFVDRKLSKVGNRHSIFLQQLSNDQNVRDAVNIKTMSSFQERDAHDSGQSYSDINTIEDYILRLGALHNYDTLVPFPIIADRTTYYFLEGFNIPKNLYEVNTETGELEFTDEILSIFMGYAEDERERIKDAKDVIKRYKAAVKRKDGSDIDILKNEMVLNYHYKLKGDQIIPESANAIKYIEFSEFNRRGFDFERDARNLIIEHLKKVVDFGMERAEKLGVYTTEIDREDDSIVYRNNLLDRDVFAKYADIYGTYEKAIRAIIAFNEIGMIISNSEINKIFTGAPAFFKGDETKSIQQDRIKRLMVLTSSGDPIHQKTTDKGVIDDTFTMASLATQKLNMSRGEYNSQDPSNYYHTLRNLLIVRYSQLLVSEIKYKDKELYNKHANILYEDYTIEKDGVKIFDSNKIDNLEKTVLRGAFGIDINDILEPYRNIDSTDGQAYVSPTMYRSMLIQLGEWPGWKERVYNNIMSRRNWDDLTTEEKNELLKFYMQPLKPVFFDLVDRGNIEVPVYLKMSVMPLFPGLVDGTKLEDLANRMEAIGRYAGQKKIDMVTYDSAVKVGLGHTTPLYSNQYTEELSDLNDLHYTSLPFSSLRRQLVTDPHDIKETKLGTQVIKINLADLMLDEQVYNIPGVEDTITGRELANIVFNCLASVSDKGLAKLKERIGYDDVTKQVDLQLLTKSLREDAIKSNMPDMIVDALRVEGDELYLELDAFSNRKQIFNRLIGDVARNTIDIEMPGNQFIQLSTTGITTTSSDNLKWYELDMAGNVKAAECAISITLFKHLIPNYKDISFKEASDYVLKHMPEILVYRIPTQGQSSAMYLRVAKLLPEQVGDTIVLPKAVTALTGSDFDIDKMFAVRHSYFINEQGELEKIRFFDKEIDGVSPQELAFEHQHRRIISQYTQRIREFQNNLFDENVPQAEKTTQLRMFIDSAIEVMPESMQVELRDILVEMEMAEFYEEWVGIKTAKRLSDLLDKWNYDEAKAEFLEKYKEASPYEYNSEQAIKNRLLDAYLSIYKNSNNIQQSQSPLGAYKKELNTLAGTITEEDSGSMFHIYSATNQNILKFEYTGGKDGIGPAALNNVHHVLSQLSGLKYRGASFGLLNRDKAGRIDLSGKLGVDHKSIMAWLSTLIEAHVDLAKDNYIMKLNVNSATYNFVMFMIRAGFGLDTFKLVSQPIIKDLANRINCSGRYSKMSLYGSKKAAMSKTMQYWEDLLSDEAKEEYKEFRLRKKEVYQFIRTDKALEKNYLNTKVENLKGDERDAFVLHQLKILHIYNHFNKMGEALNNFVQISQVDTKKFGRSVTDIIHFQKRVNDFKADNKFVNADILFPTNPSEIRNGQSLLGPYYRNSILFLLDVLPGLTMYASPGFIEIVNTILNLSGNGDTLNKKLVNTVADEVFAAIVGDFFFDVDEDGNPEENSFGLKKNNVVTVMRNVMDVITRVKFSDEPIAKRFRDNPIFSLFLKRPLASERGLPFTSYLAITRKAFSDVSGTNDFMYGILDLLSATPKDESEVEMIKEIHTFARSLFVYSYLNSGFRNRLHSFFNVIPPVLFKSLTTGKLERTLSYNEFIKDKKELFASEFNTALSVYVDRVFTNTWSNKMLVPSVAGNDITDILPNIMVPKKDPKTGEITKDWLDVDGDQNIDKYFPPKVYILGDGSSEGSSVKRRFYLGKNKDNEPVFVKYLINWEYRDDRLDMYGDVAPYYEPHLLEYVGYIKSYGSEEDVYEGGDFDYVYYEAESDDEDYAEATDTDVEETVEESEDKKVVIVHPVYKVVRRNSYEKSGIVIKVPGMTPDSFIKGANEDNLVIEDGEEIDYFNSLHIQSRIDNKEFIPVTNLVVFTKPDREREEGDKALAVMAQSGKTITPEIESETPLFDALPERSYAPTMTYAGIGSRGTPEHILSAMTEVAKELSKLGYILNTGDAIGADSAFTEGAPDDMRRVFSAYHATNLTRSIAKEIHPNWDALINKGEYAANLMARNTNQIFGAELNLPVDFVIFWAEESSNPLRPEGGTGQAVEMARRKGIPTINMVDDNWREQLDNLLTELKQRKDDLKTRKETEPKVSTSTIEVTKLGATPIKAATDKYTRESVTKDTDSLHIFTDNTDRTSGTKANVGGWYAEKYGEGLSYGTDRNPTTAVIRGLDNAYPISTMKWFYKKHNVSVEEARWTDEEFDKFKEVIDDEIDQIKKAINSGKFKQIIIPMGDAFFNTKIANITEERTPNIYKYLKNKLAELKSIETKEEPIKIISKKIKNHSMAYSMPGKDNITGVDTSTIEMCEIGLRTATTRSYPLGEVGGIITFAGRPQKYIITDIEQLTEEKVTDPKWVEKWSDKEGWTTKYFYSHLNKKGSAVKTGNYQTSFKKISDGEIAETIRTSEITPELVARINDKFKNKEGFIPYTAEDLMNMPAREFNNIIKCL